MPRLPTLDDFLRTSTADSRAHAYVRYPGFRSLYVRHTSRYFQGALITPVIDLASLEATRPGKGAFTALLQHLRETFPHCWIHIECVLNPRFAEKLPSLGFVYEPAGASACFFLPPAKVPQGESRCEGLCVEGCSSSTS